MTCWICKNCTWTSDPPNLDGPITHETLTGHKTEPTVTAASAWAPVLGKIFYENSIRHRTLKPGDPVRLPGYFTSYKEEGIPRAIMLEKKRKE
jgi:hypothetical protein